MINEEDYFIAANSVGAINEEQYKKLDVLIHTTEAISRSLYQSVYLIDYYKTGFLYVSVNPLFLCGHTAKEMKELGYSFYSQHVPEEEQHMLLEINSNGFKFFETKIAAEDKHKCYISYDFHITLDGNRKVLINHKLTPILLTEDGRIWIAMCMVSLSPQSTPGHVEFHIEGEQKYWKYDLDFHKWREKEMIQLKEEEKQVLTLCSQGLTMNEIADKMCKSIDSIKFYRRTLFDKTGTKNITEALTFATIYKLL